jgi:hypothetical protein
VDQEKLPIAPRYAPEGATRDDRGKEKDVGANGVRPDTMIEITPAESSYYEYWKRVEKDRFQ